MSHSAYYLIFLLSAVLISTVGQSAQSTTEGEKMIVTGSLIKKADQNGPSPIFSITSEDLIQLGYVNLYEALSSLTAQTGSLAEGDQFPNGFTSAAQALNLRGFGPGRTLVLVNGQRLALNPTPYQSEANFFNFAIIPTIAIERIDVLTDGASAIYGSDAIAGVINVILRDEFDGNEITFTYGTTKEGGGESRRITGGSSFRSDNATYTIGYQWENRAPFFGTDRDYFNAYSDDSFTIAIGQGPIAPAGPTLVLPTRDACDSHPELVAATSTALSEVTPSEICARNSFGDESLRNKRDTQSLYFRSSWDVNNGNAFTNLMYWQSENESRPFRLNWRGIYFDNDGNGGWDGQAPSILFREFSPLETGNQDNRLDEHSVSLNVGFEGLAEDYDYRVQFSHSDYRTEQKKLWLRANETEELFIDPLGYIDAQGRFISVDDFIGIGGPITGQPVASPIMGTPAANVFDFFQIGELNRITGLGEINASSESTSFSYWMSGESFSINDQAIEYAFIGEWNRSKYDIEVDETTADFGWSGVGGSSGIGARERLAFGTEWLFPLVRENDIFGSLYLTLAARWDEYHDSSDVRDANTWKAAIQWDLTPELTLRTTHSTSFRAPDLHYLNAANTRYFIGVVDVFECLRQNPNMIEFCRNNPRYAEQVTIDWQGTNELQEETGKTNSIGFVYQPNIDALLTLDFYDIKLSNQVGLEIESQLLLREAQCRLGTNFTTGATIDSNSDNCVDILSRVNRFDFSPDFIRGIDNLPINRAFRLQRGIDMHYYQFFQTEEIGKFGVDIQYSHILKTKIQEIATDPTTFNENFRDDPANGEIRTRANLIFSWAGDDWRSALSLVRKGSTPRIDGTGRLKSLKTLNLVVSRTVGDNDDLRFIVRNLTNERPPIDTSIGPSFYDRRQFNAVGLEGFVEYQLSF